MKKIRFRKATTDMNSCWVEKREAKATTRLVIPMLAMQFQK
jgi:hypothetical protein